MERNILSWNVTNWLTVIFMFAVFYFVIAAAISLGRVYLGGKGGPSQDFLASEDESLAA